ncbi:MAG TPA: dienelactone hydrolase family protein, partial [Gemmatimonadales bacterium]|nr:dienelactone hydrolase family protein [Gemmatimonadales bacterium]
MRPTFRSHAAVAALALAGGATGTWLLRPAQPTAAPHAASAVTTHREWVKIASSGGDSIRAYVAYPERKGKAPAVIVIHEIFGLTDWEPTVVDRLAGAGYVAIVPDLLSSKYGRT